MTGRRRTQRGARKDHGATASEERATDILEEEGRRRIRWRSPLSEEETSPGEDRFTVKHLRIQGMCFRAGWDGGARGGRRRAAPSEADDNGGEAMRAAAARRRPALR